MSHQERLKEELTQMLFPLRQHLTEVERELADLSATRTQLRAILKRIDSPAKSESKPKPGVPEEQLQTLLEWLRASYQGKSFFMGELVKQDDFDFMPKSRLSVALELLHGRGVITLDSIGQGGSRNYRVVA